jgi:hypothetical protein
MLSCFHPLTGRVLLALLIGLLVALVLVVALVGRSRAEADHRKSPARAVMLGLGIFVLLFGLTFWLGSYALSPLGFARRPALRAFIVQKGLGEPIRVGPGDGFSISRSSLAFIIPVIEPAGGSCLWQSQAGAMMDVPDICDVAYAPPPVDYDVLRLRVAPGCGLPESFGNLRIAILP